MARSPGRVVKIQSRESNGYEQTFIHIPTDVGRDLVAKGFDHAVVQYDPITSKLSFLPFSTGDTVMMNEVKANG